MTTDPFAYGEPGARRPDPHVGAHFSPVRPPRRSRRGGRVLGVLCAATVSAVLLAGCGDDDKGSGGPSASASTPGGAAPGPTSAAPSGSAGPSHDRNLTEDQAERKALVPTAKVGYEQAADAALKGVSGGRLTAIELKGGANGGGPQWHTEVATQDGTVHEGRVDAVSGKVTESRVAPDQDGDDKRKLADRLAKAKITPQQAAGTATGKKKGTVTSVKLDDNDRGAIVWSVDVVTTNDWNKTTFDVDAADKDKVLREHTDRD
ncbi:PepSY domain-containing protein [Streptomyces sp. MST-110588]|uniref:PepSY domain-containing protein n=1 Tax=Streptomyces sp. MST-110588 TaxID=2833628 RepID=UPI001F5E250E|nr:PepSY domain-containing protein [Streptomyces sp. MST-110588]UNO38853.1 PepSY domain-containing protein [Streptomyces sp. MST-110588]